MNSLYKFGLVFDLAMDKLYGTNQDILIESWEVEVDSLLSGTSCVRFTTLEKIKHK